MTLTQHIDAIIAKVNDHTLSKVDISSIVDDLTTVTSDVPLSANQGKVLKDLIDGINAILQSDDGTLDELQEVVNYIKANRSTLEALTLDNIAETADKKHFTLDEKNKLAVIEDGATADMTGAEIKAAYESEADTNAYTDAEKVLVDVGTPLGTTSTTLPGAINEVYGEVNINAANIDVIIDAMAGLSDASGSASSSVEVNIPIDGSLLAVNGYTVKTQSTDTDVFELDGATGKVTIKTPGKYSFVMTFYAKALDKDPTITPRIVINSNAGIVYDDTLGLIKVKKDGIIFPTNVLIEVTEAMLAGGDLELDMEIGHVESVNADRQVAVTGFDAVISTMGGVYSGFADHGQLTGTTDAGSHPASAISVVPQGNISSNSVQLALEEHQVGIDELQSIAGTATDKRYDKLLSVRDVIAMDYTSGDLDYVRYEGDDDATVYYRDVMAYVGGNLTQVDHFYGTADLVTASGQTVLTYDVDGNLATAIYTE
jgi:hypothetical protein